MMSVPMTTNSPNVSLIASGGAVPAPPPAPRIAPVQRSAESENDGWAEERQPDRTSAETIEAQAQAARSVRRRSDDQVTERQARTLRATLEYLRKVISPPPLDGFNEAERKARESAKKMEELAKPQLDVQA